MVSNYSRMRILKKIINYIQIEHAIKKCNIRRGANLYAFEYLKLNLNKFVKIKDVQDYCNTRTKEKTGQPLGDPPRSFEILRKDKLPLEWSEMYIGKDKYIKYTPHIKNNICNSIIETSLHKGNTFSNTIIQNKLELANYKCSITGIPESDGKLAADHFIPKEKGGKSDKNNCFIINKLLNEKKNNKMPIEWFCETLLTNFMNICKHVGILDECKEKLIKFINSY
jgi:hypothetical protein